jgi:hypothetical protein
VRVVASLRRVFQRTSIAEEERHAPANMTGKSCVQAFETRSEYRVEFLTSYQASEDLTGSVVHGCAWRRRCGTAPLPRFPYSRSHVDCDASQNRRMGHGSNNRTLCRSQWIIATKRREGQGGALKRNKDIPTGREPERSPDAQATASGAIRRMSGGMGAGHGGGC